MWFMHWTVRPKDADGMANYVDADQTATSSSDQVWTASSRLYCLLRTVFPRIWELNALFSSSSQSKIFILLLCIPALYLVSRYYGFCYYTLQPHLSSGWNGRAGFKNTSCQFCCVIYSNSHTMHAYICFKSCQM